MTTWQTLLPLEPWKLGIVGAIALYHWLSCWRERTTLPPPGQLIDIGNGVKLHAWVSSPNTPASPASPTIVLDHSLGGIEGYLLREALSQRSRLWICDRAGYGWSSASPKARTSAQIVSELQQALTLAEVKPPYLLIGDSFGSYNLRLFAHQYPDQVLGLILTDGLHETGMLALPWDMRLLKTFFGISFAIAALGAGLGMVRLCGTLGLFELFKPELRRCSPSARQQVKRSFYRASHWWTMAREIWSLDTSGRQTSEAKDLGNLPLISIQAATFLAPRLGPLRLPLRSADRVRDRIHPALLQLSQRSQHLQAPHSGHFVWVDQPEVMLQAVDKMLLNV